MIQNLSVGLVNNYKHQITLYFKCRNSIDPEHALEDFGVPFFCHRIHLWFFLVLSTTIYEEPYKDALLGTQHTVVNKARHSLFWWKVDFFWKVDFKQITTWKTMTNVITTVRVIIEGFDLAGWTKVFLKKLKNKLRFGAEQIWKCKWKVKVTQLHPALWDLMNYTGHGILHARILEWAAFPFCSGSSWPRNPTRVSCIAGGFFTNWAISQL